MFKLFAIILLAFTVTWSQFDCIKDYSDPLKEIQQSYLKQQQDFNKTSTTQQYIFEFVSIDLFPFFAIRSKAPQGTKIYLCDFNSNFIQYKDSKGDTHIIVGVVSYLKGKEIYTKTYRLYYYCKKPPLTWYEEKEPLKIIFIRQGDNFLPKD